jgi:hypothetical protein
MKTSKKTTAKGGANPAKTQALSLANLTVTWGGTDDAKQNTLTGAQIGRLIDVVRWSHAGLEDPDHGGDCWPLANKSELADHLFGIAQILRDMDDSQGNHERDARYIFLSSAQTLLAACIRCEGSDESAAEREFYRVHVAPKQAALAEGGAR